MYGQVFRQLGKKHSVFVATKNNNKKKTTTLIFFCECQHGMGGSEF